MKDFIKEVIAIIFRLSGVHFFFREYLCKNRAAVIVYHNPKAHVLDRHMRYLVKRYNLISLNKLVAAIYRKDWSGIPPKALVFTIDDGFKENYKLLEIFRRNNIYPTIYLCSHIVNTKRKFWFRTDFNDYRHLKRHNSERRLTVLKEKIKYRPQKEYPERQALDLREIRKMTPYADFQSHSRFHPILTTCSNEECRAEIEQSKICLEKNLNKKVVHFSYPNGDYAARETEYLREFGYKSGRTLDLGWNDINTDPFKLKTMGIQDNASINVLCAQISGFFGYLRYLKGGSFNGKHPPFH